MVRLGHRPDTGRTSESLLALFGGFKYLYAAQGTARFDNRRIYRVQSGAFSLTDESTSHSWLAPRKLWRMRFQKCRSKLADSHLHKIAIGYFAIISL